MFASAHMYTYIYMCMCTNAGPENTLISCEASWSQNAHECCLTEYLGRIGFQAADLDVDGYGQG